MVEVSWFRSPIYGSSLGTDLVYIHPGFLGAAVVWYKPSVAGQDIVVGSLLRFVSDVLLRCTRRRPSETHS